jgi:hypothetical protein
MQPKMPQMTDAVQTAELSRIERGSILVDLGQHPGPSEGPLPHGLAVMMSR